MKANQSRLIKKIYFGESMDSYDEKLKSTFFNSLWIKAAEESYPQDIQPYSSCTKELLLQLGETIKESKPKRILDLGCGSGGLSIWLAKEFDCTVVGLDRSVAAIQFAKNRAEKHDLTKMVTFEVASFDDIRKLSGGFDMVISVDALPFASDEDAVLSDVYRCLNKGGQLIFTTREPLPDSPKLQRLGKSWSKVLTSTGFSNPSKPIEREGVSEFWAAVYDKWKTNESHLRDELSQPVVDLLINEANEVGSRLFDGRSWWLIKARKV